MPKPKKKVVKEFVSLTWQVVRRNPEYRENYVRFLNNEGLSPEDVKPKKREDGSSIIPRHPALICPKCSGLNEWEDGSFIIPRHPARRRLIENPVINSPFVEFDFEKGRSVWEEEDEAPDPERCNWAYMMERWGFACDPDEPIPQGHDWRSALISKEWLNEDEIKFGPISNPLQPLMTEKLDLQKLPGVLEVNRWPEVWLNDENEQKRQEAGRALMAGWRPKNLQELQECLKDIYPRQWEIENPPLLTVTINLQAPSWLIEVALETLREVCKADLGIKEKKIEWKHTTKSLLAWDLKQQGLSDDEINQKVKFPRYKSGEHRTVDNRTPEMIEADQAIDGEDHLGARLKKIEEKINRGSLF